MVQLEKAHAAYILGWKGMFCFASLPVLASPACTDGGVAHSLVSFLFSLILPQGSRGLLLEPRSEHAN